MIGKGKHLWTTKPSRVLDLLETNQADTCSVINLSSRGNEETPIDLKATNDAKIQRSCGLDERLLIHFQQGFWSPNVDSSVGKQQQQI